MRRLAVTLSEGNAVPRSPSRQNLLAQQIVAEFCPRFTSGAVVLYLGDTADKVVHLDRDGLAGLDIRVEEHGKMPDVIVYFREKHWLVHLAAVTSHGRSIRCDGRSCAISSRTRPRRGAS